jgi:hypothetical protein
MSQQHVICNLDRHEFISPARAGAFEGTLRSLDWALTCLSVLLAASNGQGSGDLADGRDVNEPLYAAVSGRWAGDRIAIIGDYWSGAGATDDRALPVTDGPETLYDIVTGQRDGWTDITEHVCEYLDLDGDLRNARHEVHSAPSGQTWTVAAGFHHEDPMPVPPRSTLHPDGTITAIASLPAVEPLSEPAAAAPLDAERVDELRDALTCARNFSGPLPEDVRAAIILAAVHPTPRTWDAAAHKTISPAGPGTVWSAVLAVDAEFPQSVPSAGRYDEYAAWPVVPSGQTILHAIQAAVSS